MNKLTKEEIVKRMDETEKVLLERLHLKKNLSIEGLNDFYVKFIPYLLHDRNDKMLGRTPEKLKENIDKYIDFCIQVGLSERDIIDSIGSFPAILHTFDDEFVDKYVIIGVVENADNTVRKENLIKNPRAFMMDIKTVYSRYCLMRDLNYTMNWSNLVKATNEEFMSIFVKSKYSKSHKIFKTVEEGNMYLEKNYPLDYNVINELRRESVNVHLFSGGYGKK